MSLPTWCGAKSAGTHRHGSPNGYLLPVNRAIAPINNNYRDGYMQPQIFVGDSTSSPNGIGGVVSSSTNATVVYTGNSVASAGNGPIGRFAAVYDWFGQARNFWGGLDTFAQQHTVDGYRFELGNVACMRTGPTPTGGRRMHEGHAPR